MLWWSVEIHNPVMYLLTCWELFFQLKLQFLHYLERHLITISKDIHINLFLTPLIISTTDLLYIIKVKSFWNIFFQVYNPVWMTVSHMRKKQMRYLHYTYVVFRRNKLLPDYCRYRQVRHKNTTLIETRIVNGWFIPVHK